MTTRAENLPALFTRTGGFPWRRLVLSFLLTLMAVIVFVGAFAAAYASVHVGKVLPGVQVGGISLAGLDRPSADAALREQLPSLRSGHLTVIFGDVQQRISYDSIDRDYDMAGMLDQAFAVGRQGSLVEQLQDQLALLMNGVTIEPQMAWNEDALEAQLVAIAAQTYVAPVDARIERQAGQFVVQPSSEGRTVDLRAGVQQALVAVDTLSAADTVVRIEPTPLLPEVTTAQAQAAVDRAESIVAADLTITGGGTTETLSADQVRGWLRLEETAPGTWELALEEAPIAQWVAAVAAATDVEPVDASFALRDGNVIAVAGETGQSVDVEATTEAVYSALMGRAEGGPPTPTINMSIAVTEPDFTTEEAIAAAPRVVKVSGWTTKFTEGESNFFGGNIHSPARHLNGMVVAPGDTFDFWAALPDDLTELGDIGPGGIILRGRTNPTGAIGGGICSVSTTLFNAAARAGLDINKRKAHSFYITRYPLGLDATVWKTRSAAQTFSFINDTEYPVLIRTVNGPGKTTFEIWTVPTGRTVEFSEPRVENIKPPKHFLEYSDDLPAGKTKLLQVASRGFESWVTRTVTDADGNVIHQDTFYSKYRVANGITLVGRAPGDPPAGTQIDQTEQ